MTDDAPEQPKKPKRRILRYVVGITLLAVVGLFVFYAPWPPTEFRARRTFARCYPGAVVHDVVKIRESDTDIHYVFRFQLPGNSQIETATVDYVKHPEGGWVEISAALPNSSP